MVYVALVLLVLLLTTIPTKKNKNMKWMKGYSFHRGKFSKDQSIPENSLAAIQASINQQVDIEFDVRITQDNQLIVFHDETLERMCGVDLYVENMTYDAVKEFYLKDTHQTIPTLKEVLDLVEGKVNLLIEIKPTQQIETVCQLVIQNLEYYNGNYAICSFHPMVVAYFKKHHPEIIRGQIIRNFLFDKKQTFVNRIMLTINGFNFYTRSDFISVQYQMVEWFTWMRFFNAFVCTWAVHDKKWLNRLKKKVDHMIIEYINYER